MRKPDAGTDTRVVGPPGAASGIYGCNGVVVCLGLPGVHVEGKRKFRGGSFLLNRGPAEVLRRQVVIPALGILFFLALFLVALVLLGIIWGVGGLILGLVRKAG